MYIDDGSDGGELKVTVSGEEYTAEANYDYNEDGFEDSVVVDTDDDGQIVYTDTDYDGEVDSLATFSGDDRDPQVARFDAADGEWVAEDRNPDRGGERGEAGGPARDASAGEVLAVTTEDGSHEVVQATVDTDDDGVNDTATVERSGSTLMYTDMDGDGTADRVTEIGADGQSETRQLDDEQSWAVAARTEFAESGPDGSEDDSAWAGLFADGASHGNNTEGVVRIDASTGQWISPN